MENFGGYVSYTVGGFKCLPFGTQLVANVINAAADDLDIPPSMALRPGRGGFRRSLLYSTSGKVFTYSAFIGLSEPTVNRLGSFLAIGVAAPWELDCVADKVGQCLFVLLENLAGRVSDGSRFTSEPNVDVFNAFLRHNSRALEAMKNGSKLADRKVDLQSGQVPVFLSEEKAALDAVFNRVCADRRSDVNFFLFDAAAGSELQTGKSTLRIVRWPIKVAKPAERPASLPLEPIVRAAMDLKENATTVGIGEPERARPYERYEKSDAESHERLDEMEAALSFWKYVALGSIATIFLALAVVTGLTRSWISSSDERVEELHRQLRAAQAAVSTNPEAVQSQEADPQKRQVAPVKDLGFEPKERVAEEDQSSRPQRIYQEASFRELKSRYCRFFPGDQSAFEARLKAINPALATTDRVKRNTSLLLPLECANR